VAQAEPGGDRGSGRRGLDARTYFGTLLTRGADLACAFYRSGGGQEPVRDWLRSLPSAVCKEIGSDIQKVQWRWPVSRPLVAGFGGGLYEVRTSIDGNIYRVFFCIHAGAMVLLHGFMKKTQKTPESELAAAQARQKEVEGA
jgi:phage-related protein